MVVLYSILGSLVGTIVANAGIVVFGVLLKNKKGGGVSVKKD